MKRLRGTQNEEGAGTYIGKSGTKNLEAECVRRRAESTGGCVQLKNEGTNDFVFEINEGNGIRVIESRARDTNKFITESVYLVLTVESPVLRIWRLIASEEERRTREDVYT